MSNVRVFVTFDRDHDEDLRDRLLEHSSRPGSGFDVSGRSDEVGRLTSTGRARLRCSIREADEVIVICGVHTGDSASADAAIRIAQEEQKPYLLLWGRRDAMCSKPPGASAGDSMYSWTWENLCVQVALTLKNSRPCVIPDRYKRA